MNVERVISGGQIGADLAGLQAAAELGIPTGGLMPRHFLTKTGRRPDIALTYGLAEDTYGPVGSSGYASWTWANVLAADATVVFAVDLRSRGTALTMRACRALYKPMFAVELYISSGVAQYPQDAGAFRDWLGGHGVRTLNVAGNSLPAIEGVVRGYLLRALAPRPLSRPAAGTQLGLGLAVQGRPA